MLSSARPSSLPTHLLRIESFVQTAADLAFESADTEHCLFYSIDDARDEIRRRYQDALARAFYISPDEAQCVIADDHAISSDIPDGLAYDYRQPLYNQEHEGEVPHRDLVQVFSLAGALVAPTHWEHHSNAAERDFVLPLVEVLSELLTTTELNLDEIEPSTRLLIAKAHQLLDASEHQE